jgi:FkbM family methyltransferase
MPADHISYLVKLKESGFEPKVIYDIGCCVLQWTRVAQRLWPEAKIVVFDAFQEASFLWKDYDYHVGVLSTSTGNLVKYYKNCLFPTGNSYYKENNEKYFPPNQFEDRITDSLDDVVKQRRFPLPDLVKIDVQGCEKDIITGGVETLKCAKHLIVEMQSVEYNQGAPNVCETLPFIEEILGMRCVAPLFCNNGPDGDYGFVKN